MTKLEAWEKWREEAHVTNATEYTQAFSAGWDAAFDKYAKIFDSHEKTAAQSKVERIAMWMSVNNYATGHGDTVEDLLKELEWQIAEREREACAELCEEMEDRENPYERNVAVLDCAAAIRARGEK